MLQIPYSVDFTEEQARKQMLPELFRQGETGNCLIQKLGIIGDYTGGYAERLEDSDWREIPHKYNVMLNRHFRAGYWEIAFAHTKPLGIIPGG